MTRLALAADAFFKRSNILFVDIKFKHAGQRFMDQARAIGFVHLEEVVSDSYVLIFLCLPLARIKAALRVSPTAREGLRRTPILPRQYEADPCGGRISKQNLVYV
jgi:hypothetical protein